MVAIGKEDKILIRYRKEEWTLTKEAREKLEIKFYLGTVKNPLKTNYSIQKLQRVLVCTNNKLSLLKFQNYT